MASDKGISFEAEAAIVVVLSSLNNKSFFCFLASFRGEPTAFGDKVATPRTPIRFSVTSQRELLFTNNLAFPRNESGENKVDAPQRFSTKYAEKDGVVGGFAPDPNAAAPSGLDPGGDLGPCSKPSRRNHGQFHVGGESNRGAKRCA